jgi:2-polyprenyl-3-methyl-5-hydroxy-6-metoxy-1,4-benzoquinol methylase
MNSVWDNFWQNPDPRIANQVFNPKLIASLVSSSDTLVDKLIIETGSGTALDSIELARRGASVIAVDLSEYAIHLARQKAGSTGADLTFVKADLLELPFDSHSIDVVFHSGVLEHFKDPEVVLQEQHRVLKKGGILLVDVPQKYNLYTIHKARQMVKGSWFAGWETQFSIRELRTLLMQNGFDIIEQYGYGYYPRLFAKIRWASSIGKGIWGHPIMPKTIAESYERFWLWFENRAIFLNIAQCIGVVSRKK